MKIPACLVAIMLLLRHQDAAGQIDTDHAVAIFYVIPADIPFEDDVNRRLLEATLDIQAWYQCASGGLTWSLAFPEVVRVYLADQPRDFYQEHGFYGVILNEMAAKGLPVFSPGTVAALWTRGAGFFAGANPLCNGECGVAQVGVEVFPEFNHPEWSGGACPEGVGVAAFPCTPLGAFAHELGHALASLPHPFDVPETRADAFHSIMQTHWNYPTHAPPAEQPWGFLTVERAKLAASPFLRADVDILRPHDCDVVNLPPTGPTPTADFELHIEGLTVSAENTSQDASLFYWTFGDGAVSNRSEPVHTYAEPGTYVVTLRASSDESMMDLARVEVELSACRGFNADAKIELGSGANHDEFKARGTIEVGEISNGIDPLTEEVTLQIGPFRTTIPAGAFEAGKKRFTFEGDVNGVELKVVIQRLGGRRFRLRAKGEGADLAGTSNPVRVGLTVGDDRWCATSTAEPRAIFSPSRLALPPGAAASS